MKKAFICGQWEMEFETPANENFKVSSEKKSYLVHIFSSHMEDISANMTAASWTLEGLPHLNSCLDFFGGAGLRSLIVKKLYRPRRHTIIEQDLECLEHLRRVFPPYIKVRSGDAWKQTGQRADLVMLDWNSWTILHWPLRRAFLEDVFLRQPLAVEIFDSSKSYFHVNKAKYSRVLRCRVETPQDYARGCSAFFLKEIGYSFAKAAYTPRGAYYLLKSGTQIMEERIVSRGSGGFIWV